MNTPVAPQSQSAPPPIQWAHNNNALTWHLIGLVEESENQKVLVGKGQNEVCCIFILEGKMFECYIHLEF